MVHILYVQKGSYNEERSELNWKEIGEKLFSEGEKFPTVGRKFDAAKKIAVKISCGENSGDEIARVKWDAAKISCTEI